MGRFLLLTVMLSAVFVFQTYGQSSRESTASTTTKRSHGTQRESTTTATVFRTITQRPTPTTKTSVHTVTQTITESLETPSSQGSVSTNGLAVSVLVLGILLVLLISIFTFCIVTRHIPSPVPSLLSKPKQMRSAPAQKQRLQI